MSKQQADQTTMSISVRGRCPATVPQQLAATLVRLWQLSIDLFKYRESSLDCRVYDSQARTERVCGDMDGGKVVATMPITNRHNERVGEINAGQWTAEAPPYVVQRFTYGWQRDDEGQEFPRTAVTRFETAPELTGRWDSSNFFKFATRSKLAAVFGQWIIDKLGYYIWGMVTPLSKVWGCDLLVKVYTRHEVGNWWLVIEFRQPRAKCAISTLRLRFQPAAGHDLEMRGFEITTVVPSEVWLK